MTMNQFECPADMDALNTELQARHITAGLLAAVFLIEAPAGTGMGSMVERYRVLYWEPTPAAG